MRRVQQHRRYLSDTREASCFLLQALLGEKEGFLTKARLGHYDSKRNDPNADAVSGLSGYFHFGQLAPQRAALEAGKHRNSSKVRRALTQHCSTSMTSPLLLGTACRQIVPRGCSTHPQ